MRKPMTPARLGRGMKMMRGLASLTREELADRAGISVTTIRAVERGKTFPNLATVDRIMTGLGLDWDIQWTPREDQQT